MNNIRKYWKILNNYNRNSDCVVDLGDLYNF